MTDRALLLMDYQNAVCGPDGAIGSRSGASAHTAERGVLGRAAACAAAARRAGDLVVFVRVAFDPAFANRTNRSTRFGGMEANRLLLEGSVDAEFCPEVVPEEGDVVITKGCVSPFVGTALDALLRVHGVRRLLLGGVATNLVVESAARHAGDSGYDVTVLEDLCASYDEDAHRFAITRTLPVFAAVRTSGEVYDAGGDP